MGGGSFPAPLLRPRTCRARPVAPSRSRRPARVVITAPRLEGGRRAGDGPPGRPISSRGPEAEVRRAVLAIDWAVLGAPAGPTARPAAGRYRRILADHSFDWRDGRARLEFLAEVVRGVELAQGERPGQQTPTAHPGG